MPATLALLITDRMERTLATLAAQRAGFAPLVCEDTAALRETLRDHARAILLLDMHLPGANGLRLLEALRAEGLLGQTAVVLLSAFGFPEVVKKARDAGARDFIVKPLDGDALVERLQRLQAK